MMLGILTAPLDPKTSVERGYEDTKETIENDETRKMQSRRKRLELEALREQREIEER